MGFNLLCCCSLAQPQRSTLCASRTKMSTTRSTLCVKRTDEFDYTRPRPTCLWREACYSFLPLCLPLSNRRKRRRNEMKARGRRAEHSPAPPTHPANHPSATFTPPQPTHNGKEKLHEADEQRLKDNKGWDRSIHFPLSAVLRVGVLMKI